MNPGRRTRLAVLSLLVAFFGAGCAEEHEVLDDLEGVSYALVDQDSAAVTFPDDLEGKITLVGYVYTHCPDICPMTTANMKNVLDGLDDPEDVQFVTLTFDPTRDTPGVLRRYRELWQLDDAPWHFLTADSATTDSLMQRMGVRYEIAGTSTTEAGEEIYFINHTDQVTLLDQQGRVHRHYGGSRTPPEILIEDINALR